MKYWKKAPIALITIASLIFCTCSDSDECPTCPEQEIELNIINDLTTGIPGFSSIVLNWSAPNSAYEYDIRYSISIIDSSNWASATQVVNESAPLTEGEIEILKIEGLESNTDYYFALKFRINSTDWSVLSNIASCYTSVYDSRDKIVFRSDIDGDAEIFTINSDGTDLTQITSNNASDGGPAWISNGTDIVFSSDLDGYTQLYTMNYKGDSLTNISNNHYSDSYVSIMYPSNKLVFVSEQGAQNNIVSMDIVGTNRNIETNSNDYLDLYPSWLPDGSRIYFYRYSLIGGPSGICVKAAGMVVLFIEDATYLSCSPDGSQIAYCAFDGSDNEIFIADADGSNPVQLTDNDSTDEDPNWSPDGTKIVFVSDRDSDNEIYIMDIDGSNVIQLTHNTVYDSDPSWSPML